MEKKLKSRQREPVNQVLRHSVPTSIPHFLTNLGSSSDKWRNPTPGIASLPERRNENIY